MKKTLILISLLLYTLAVFSQNCTDENVTQIPGKWKVGMRGSSDQSAADMVKEKALMDDIIKTIRTNFTWSPIGGEITYGNSYSIRGLDYRPLPIIKICNQYSPYVFYQHYFCNHGKIALEDFALRVATEINNIPLSFPQTFFKSKKDKLGYDIDKDPETDIFGYVEKLPEVKNGMIEYDKIISGSNFPSGDVLNVIERYRILIKPGLLPFAVMSKKEYYEKWKIRHLQAIEGYEIVKQQYVDAAKPSSNERDRDIMMQDDLIKLVKNYISKIDEILSSKTADELAGPAFDGEENGEYYETSTKHDPHRYIIKPNFSYYNNTLPRSSPQVITIRFIYHCNTDRDGEKSYDDGAFYNELERMKIFDLLTAKLQPLIVR